MSTEGGYHQPLNPPAPVPAPPLPEDLAEDGPDTDGASGPAGNGAVGGHGGRHARRPGQQSTPVPLPKVPRLDYLPRHAADADAQPVSPTDRTEVLSRVREDPTEAPRKDRPESAPVPPPPTEPEPGEVEMPPEPEKPLPRGKRVRVVLSQRKGQNPRPVRTVVDVEELTQVGEVLSSSLIRSQLALALRIAAIALLGLGALPAMFFCLPRLASFELFGVRLAWLVLGVAAYPFLLLLGWLYMRAADKVEQIFADHIQS